MSITFRVLNFMFGSTLQNANPIYNLLPDILSSLSTDADLPPAEFQAIMHALLEYIKKVPYALQPTFTLCPIRAQTLVSDINE